MATVQNKRGDSAKQELFEGELKTSVVKDKPLIHTSEENKDEPHYHNVAMKNYLKVAE